MRIEFVDIPLESDQKDLLAKMLEADRAATSKGRQPFLLIRVMEGNYVSHPGIKDGDGAVYPGDLQTLADYGLLRLTVGTRGNEIYDLTPMGKQYYEWMKAQEGEPTARLEGQVRRLLGSGTFQERHTAAYGRWAAAEGDLWGADTDAKFTGIGHACREAVQQFVTDLVDWHKPEDVDPDPQHTVARLRVVMATLKLSESVEAFAAALLAYFGTVSDLVVRQEHGGQKEGEPLEWEDARRVVFQTAMVMFELDRAVC
jgi:hypothetical protein